MKKLFKTISAGLLSMSLLCGAVVMARGINENVENVHAADGETVTVTFSLNDVKVDSAEVNFTDSNGVAWTCKTVGTTSFTNDKSKNYSQIGSSKKPASSITFSASVAEPSFKLTSFISEWGGFSGTAGTISMKVNGSQVATGKLSAATDVTVDSGDITTDAVSSFEISVTGISKGVKIYNLSYTYVSASTNPSISFDKKSIDNLLTGDNDTLSASAANFTPTSYVWESLNEEVATVSGNNETASVTGVKKGSTQIKVTASDGTNSVSETIDVTVLTKPAKIVVDDGSGEMEVEVGKSKRPSVSVYDADNQEITTDEEKAYTMSIVSGANVVSLSGTTQINGDKVGTAVVRFTSTLVESVYFDLTLNVKEDSLVSINSVAIKDASKEYLQGDTFSSADIVASGIYYFSKDKEVSEGFTFSLDETASSSEDSSIILTKNGSVTVYIFNNSLPSWKGELTISVKEVIIPITSIEVEGIELDSDVSLPIGKSLTINTKVLPENTTENKDLLYSIECDREGALVFDEATSTLTAVKGVAEEGDTGMMSITSKVNSEVSFEFMITVAREEMTLRVNKPGSISKVTSNDQIVSGDKYYIVYENNEGTAYVFNGLDAANGYTKGSISNGVLTVDGDSNYENAVTISGDSTNGYSIKINSGTNAGKYIYGTSGSNKLNFNVSEQLTSISFEDETNSALIVSNETYFRFNNVTGQNRFRFYKPDKDTKLPTQQPVYLYHVSKKVSEDIIVSDSLLTAVRNAEKEISCDPTGQDSRFMWDKVTNAINALNDTEKSYLVYGVANENGNEVEQFLAKYDYIVNKYSEYADFLNRNVNNAAKESVNSLSSLMNDSQTFVVVIISLSLLSTLLIVKKKYSKKEN